jgi:hypothetical protein
MTCNGNHLFSVQTLLFPLHPVTFNRFFGSVPVRSKVGLVQKILRTVGLQLGLARLLE